MTTAFFEIETAFQTKLAGITGAPHIDFENNIPYTPTAGTRFWRTQNDAGNTKQITLGGLRQHQGVYTVDVIVPNGIGMKVILNDMDSIASMFDVPNVLYDANGVKVQVIGVSRGKVLRDESWLVGFVSINYICYSD